MDSESSEYLLEANHPWLLADIYELLRRLSPSILIDKRAQLYAQYVENHRQKLRDQGIDPNQTGFGVIDPPDDLIEEEAIRVIDEALESVQPDHDLYWDMMVAVAMLDNALDRVPPSDIVDDISSELTTYVVLKDGHSLLQAVNGSTTDANFEFTGDLERLIRQLRKTSQVVRYQAHQSIQDWNQFKQLINDYRAIQELEDIVDSPMIIIDDRNPEHNLAQLLEVDRAIVRLIPQVDEPLSQRLEDMHQSIQQLQNPEATQGDLSSSSFLENRVPEQLQAIDQLDLALSIIERIENGVASGRLRLDRNNLDAMRIIVASTEPDANKKTVDRVVRHFQQDEYNRLEVYLEDMIRSQSIDVTNFNELQGSINGYIIQQLPYLSQDSNTTTDYSARLIRTYYYHPELVPELTEDRLRMLENDVFQYLNSELDSELLQSRSTRDVIRAIHDTIPNVIRVVSPTDEWIRKLAQRLINYNMTEDQVESMIMNHINDTWSWNWVNRLESSSLEDRLTLIVSTSIPSRYEGQVQEFVNRLYNYLVIPTGIEAREILDSNLLTYDNDLSLDRAIDNVRRDLIGRYPYLQRDPRTLNYYIATAIKRGKRSERDGRSGVEFIAVVLNWDIIDREDEDNFRRIINEAFQRFDIQVSDYELDRVFDYYKDDGEEFHSIVRLIRPRYSRLIDRYNADIQKIGRELNLLLRQFMTSMVPYLTYNSSAYLTYTRKIMREIGFISIPDELQRSPPLDPTTRVRRRSPIRYDRYDNPDEWTASGDDDQPFDNPEESTQNYQVVIGQHIMDVLGYNLLLAYGY